MILIYVKLVQKKKEKVNIMAAVERNSDGSYDAVDSGGFGKDYHGQDAFGERIGGTGIGGSHFGGFEEGHVGLDKDNTGKYEKLSSEALAQTETMDKPDTGSLFDGSEEGEANSDMKDSLRDLNSESSEESSKVSSLDTGMLIGENEDEKAKSSFTDKMETKESKELENVKNNETAKEKMNKSKEKMDDLEKRLNFAEEEHKEQRDFLDEMEEELNKGIDYFDKGFHTSLAKDQESLLLSRTASSVEKYANTYGFGIDEETKARMANPSTAPGAMRGVVKDVRDMQERRMTKVYDSLKSQYDAAKAEYETSKADYDKSLESSFTDRMKESKESDYLTKANKDSTKELPKEGPSRNDYGNHAVNTLKGVTDIVAENSTAKALGLKSVEDFARENGLDPEKLSTMKAYQAYQNKEILKAIPKVAKKVGSYIVERIKDFFDPSQLPERIRNTLARYNAATLVGAAILSIQSGAGIQASIDQALTMVNPEDQTAVSDFLEDVLKDRDTVKDLSNAIDGALAPEENSNTSELDESIVNIGRKDNTDYDDFNAGLGTTSDADAKVFIARNIREDPILRRMISKMEK